ncbi:manganese efflux pump MntP family protein [Microaerobacter geothermalis]|uniref:manganese efflux pump MntP n=1 Tax=Microaerobacter geothermalis TaxID=674972 RepID=UPI001F3751D6|nr:manganese efflux pump [Microaerobacter geothermalis]MCF6093202.1 manganese efflux pump MntP family protein [Microaerobacter geothermalis]
MGEIAQWGQFVTLFMVATALGMDAFSLGLGVGMVGIRLKHVAKVSATIGIFHVIMPLFGMYLGKYLTTFIGNLAGWLGGGILLTLGLQMIWSSFKGGQSQSYSPHGWGLLLFAFSVSLDSFSVGLTFGLFAVNVILAVSLFGFMGMIMAGTGLLLGRRFGLWLGEYGEALGGFILLAYGVKFLL